MGKRSTNTTKSGKFMNPTDQARKEARKRELKKNKKQRMMVRQAVLKGKDPTRILVELAEVDDMEYNLNAPPSLGEKVLREKRRKLLEMFTRVMKLYEKEDVEYYTELLGGLTEYNKSREEKKLLFEEVKSAEGVLVDDIPLPEFPLDGAEDTAIADIPLPTSDIALPQTKGILKRSKPVEPEPTRDDPSYNRPDIEKLRPPGPPPGPPPYLSDSEGEEDDYEEVLRAPGVDEEEEEGTAPRSKRIRFDVEDEDDEEEKDSRLTSKKARAQSSIQSTMFRLAGQTQEMPDERGPQAPPLSAMGPGQLMRLPPGPPPIRQLPPGPPPGLPPNLRGMVPPRPPPGLPPRLVRPMAPPPGMVMAPPPGPNVLSAPPSIQRPPPIAAGPMTIAARSTVMSGAATSGGAISKPASATIEAKPQIKHHIGDVTRFTPTTLRVKRGDAAKRAAVGGGKEGEVAGGVNVMKTFTMSSKTKDDVYDEFMKEMGDMIN